MTVYTIFTIIGIAALVLTGLRWFIARPTNWLICYLQNFVGSLFIFSGFVKAVDPLGTGYKMHEYFEAFAGEGLRPVWEYLATWSTFMAIVMIALELFIGLMLIIGWKPKLTVAIIWWLTLFFTILTGYTYLSGYSINLPFIIQAVATFIILTLVAVPDKADKRNKIAIVAALFTVILVGRMWQIAGAHPFVETKMKVTDCGCFGDFIKLKPWETFWKDVILDFMIIILVLGTKHIRPVFGNVTRNAIAGVSGIVSLSLCLYTVYMNEPIIDFRPYAIGSDINEARKEKVPAKVEMVFVYRSNKTGQPKEFSYDDVMKGKMDYAEYDSMLERKDKVLDPGIPAKITNLRIENDEGGDITDTLLHDPNYSLMVVSHDLSKTSEAAFKQLNVLAAAAEKAGVKFYAVTLNDGHVEEFRHRNQTAFPFYSADATPLKTIIRSNPGLVLFKNGVVINKWHHKHLPGVEELNSEYFKK
ncbi:MAG TPA: DoxX family protein [Chitinophagales bacterium]|nr:DoxX family protein [Chitinophagales bacterium]